MRQILDNPKAFFDSFSTAEFDKLLDEFGFEYEIESKNESIEVKYFNYSNLTTYKNTSFKNFTSLNCNLNKERNLSKLLKKYNDDIYTKISANIEEFITNDEFVNDYTVNEFDNDFEKAA